MLRRTKWIRFWTNYKLTIACLLWLFVLTLWGTVYQVNHGLYPAQQKIFNSWFIPAWGFLPLPGARTILWILFFNLLTVTFFRFQYRLSKLGVLVLHLGMFLLIFSSWVTLHFAVESNLTLEEKEASNVSADYHHWEISAWTQSFTGDTLLKQVEAHDLSGLKPGDILPFEQHGMQATLYLYYPNSRGLLSATSGARSPPPLNASGIRQLDPQEASRDPVENFPGVVLSLHMPDGGKQNVLLYGGEGKPTPVVKGDELVYFQLRRKRYVLPVTLGLVDFQKEEHPGTRIAKSYKSVVEMFTEAVHRRLTIYMNNPLRVEDFTFYQASFGVSNQGESSTLAVVQHPGRLLPYIASIVVALGLVIHFCLMLWKYAGRQNGRGGRGGGGDKKRDAND